MKMTNQLKKLLREISYCSLLLSVMREDHTVTVEIIGCNNRWSGK